MKLLVNVFVLLFLLLCLDCGKGRQISTVADPPSGSSTPSSGKRSQFQHIVVIVQENRTPDNLFQGLCTSSGICSTTPTSTQYDIQTRDWLDQTSSTGITQPGPIPLANAYDLDHAHGAFTAQCDLDPTTGKCKMDGAASVTCPVPSCPQKPQFKFVDNSTGVLDPYLTLATEYGWANFMFQTNQGSSFPAHQFIFGATSAPSLSDDRAGTFVSEEPTGRAPFGSGCTAHPGVVVQLIDSAGIEDPTNRIFPCFEHDTVADLLEPRSVSWRYYTPGASHIWTAPDAINHICVPMNGSCTGADFVNNVDLRPPHVLGDASSPTCNLREVSWVIPSGQNSDHAGYNKGGGPSWVSSIVNAIGASTCKNPDGSSYWDTTAILITWDDWGGWYDHEPPTILASPQGGYQYGFRVPLIVVSAFTPAGYISNQRNDFGSIIRFIEQNFGITEGALTFADARATGDLMDFFRLDQAPRPFQTVPSKLNAEFFVNDRTPMSDPDDD